MSSYDSILNEYSKLTQEKSQKTNPRSSSKLFNRIQQKISSPQTPYAKEKIQRFNHPSTNESFEVHEIHVEKPEVMDDAEQSTSSRKERRMEIKENISKEEKIENKEKLNRLRNDARNLLSKSEFDNFLTTEKVILGSNQSGEVPENKIEILIDCIERLLKEHEETIKDKKDSETDNLFIHFRQISVEEEVSVSYRIHEKGAPPKQERNLDKSIAIPMMELKGKQVTIIFRVVTTFGKIGWTFAFLKRDDNIESGLLRLPLMEDSIQEEREIIRNPGKHYMDIEVSTEKEFSDSDDFQIPSYISQEVPDRILIVNSNHTGNPVECNDHDKFILYIDSARFLPDSVLITSVSVNIFDDAFSQQHSTFLVPQTPDSTNYFPEYNFSTEFPCFNTTSYLVLTISAYTILESTEILGHSIFPIFSNGKLNSGNHSLPIFLPPLELDDDSLTLNSKILNSCLNIRVVLNPENLSRENIPEKEWGLYGLFIDKPDFESGNYDLSQLEYFKALDKQEYLSKRVETMAQSIFMEDFPAQMKQSFPPVYNPMSPIQPLINPRFLWKYFNGFNVSVQAVHNIQLTNQNSQVTKVVMSIVDSNYQSKAKLLTKRCKFDDFCSPSFHDQKELIQCEASNLALIFEILNIETENDCTANLHRVGFAVFSPFLFLESEDEVVPYLNCGSFRLAVFNCSEIPEKRMIQDFLKMPFQNVIDLWKEKGCIRVPRISLWIKLEHDEQKNGSEYDDRYYPDPSVPLATRNPIPEEIKKFLQQIEPEMNENLV